ncbi:hypothetical protein D3C73_1188830 [compost metagenome]
MRAGGLQRSVIHDDAVFLFFQNPFVGWLQEVIVAIDDGVLAVQNAEQLNRTAPGMVMRSVYLFRPAA